LLFCITPLRLPSPLQLFSLYCCRSQH
jgi:hypothetical protein